MPGVILGLQAIIGTIWWALIMVISIKSSSTESDLKTLSGEVTLPIGWWWERIGETNKVELPQFAGADANKYWLFALSLMFSFVFYFLISVIELFSWLIYMITQSQFARFYFSTVGYWGSIFGYAIPWIFAVAQVLSKPLTDTH